MRQLHKLRAQDFHRQGLVGIKTFSTNLRWPGSKASLKRGARSPHVALDENLLVSTEPPADAVALDEALTALAAIDQRKSQVVELRFFGGLGIEEAAEVLKVSPETVKRDWKLAKAWLRRELRHYSDIRAADV